MIYTFLACCILATPWIAAHFVFRFTDKKAMGGRMYCHDCGYLLDGLGVSRPCPECGGTTVTTVPPTEHRQRVKFILVYMACACLCLGGGLWVIDSSSVLFVLYWTLATIPASFIFPRKSTPFESLFIVAVSHFTMSACIVYAVHDSVTTKDALGRGISMYYSPVLGWTVAGVAYFCAVFLVFLRRKVSRE